ncbi:uncharacterized protein Aud_010955 [Aspergillus udagawae]|uniref:Uncharacterized protein n=1 Tax=Aspergillus udagawae TaxID=91492 RepID=A0A8E0R1S4_9EURO|nr:uncharacterized protein Aud_010955 [Aspergillus udagawae]GIC94455.1 hypothetical protein Aud_010955 [Aspergillus udagawae]
MAGAIQSSDTDPAEIMRLAVEGFRAKMEASNRRFLQDRIDEIEAMGLSTEEEKFNEMSLYWHDLGAKCEPKWNNTASPGHVRQSREARNATRLEDVKTIYHQYMDGIISPTLVTDKWRQMYLEVLKGVCNEAMAQNQGGEDEDFEIPMCYELGHFIKYANGVQDPDFRRSGICPFEPVPPVGREEYAFPEHAAVLRLPTPRVSTSREILKEYLRGRILDETFILGTVDEDLEVKVGFQTGLGCRAGHDEWYSAYLYCRRCDDDSDPSLKDWAWRVSFFRADVGNPTTLYGRYPRFDSIPEFLDWYSSWLVYVDMNEVRKNVRCLYGDDDYYSDMN